MEKELTLAEINDFKRKYFENVDYSYWEDRLYLAWKRYTTLKKPKNKAKYLVDIYSIYIQVTEIALINMYSLAARPGTFILSLSVGNKEIRNFAAKALKNTAYLERFIKNFSPKDITQKELSEEISLLKECFKEYTTDFNFLNAFKHGFRVRSTHGQNSISLAVSPDKVFKIFEGDSEVKYYYFKFEKGEPVSFNEDTITFNHQRIFGKTLFLITLLSRVRLGMIAALGEEKFAKRFPRFTITDREAWNSSFGRTHFPREMYSFRKKDENESRKQD